MGQAMCYNVDRRSCEFAEIGTILRIKLDRAVSNAYRLSYLHIRLFLPYHDSVGRAIFVSCHFGRKENAMKKRVLSLLLLLPLLCMVACQGADTETAETPQKPTDTTTTPPPEEPPPFVMEPGIPYYCYTSKIPSSTTTPTNISLDEINMQRAPRYWHYDVLMDQIYIQEENIPDITFEWEGLELRGTYSITSSMPIGIGTFAFSREYKIDGYGSVFYFVDTGLLARIDFRSADAIVQNPTDEKLTQEECGAIAREYIDKYIATYAPDIDLSAYSYREMDLNKYNFYNFVYDKYIGGRLALNGGISCGVNEYGHVVYFGYGDDFSAVEERVDETVLESYYAQLRVIAEEILEKNPNRGLIYTIAEGYFQKTADGKFFYLCGINLYYRSTNSNPLVLTFVVLV